MRALLARVGKRLERQDIPNRILVKEGLRYTDLDLRKSLILNGEMSEWLKEHAWKAISVRNTDRYRNTS
jgi:hypothetical protein